MIIKFLQNLNLKTNYNEPILTIVGVGPGDPSLLTIAGAEAIKKANLVAFPVSKKDGKSIAAEIASKFINGKRTLPLVFPMVLDKNLLKDAWDAASLELIKELKSHHRVAFLTLGDVSLYSTGAYIINDIKLNYPECKVKLIPGINSFSAAAAIAQYPLAIQKEKLLISIVPDTKTSFNKILDDALSDEMSIVFLKLGERWVWVREILKERELLDKTLFAQRVGFSDQDVVMACNVPAESKPYFSLLIIRNSIPDLIKRFN